MVDLSHILDDALVANAHLVSPVLPNIEAEEFAKVVETRRSVRLFLPDPIPEEVVDRCLDLALLSPSASNFCPWEFYRITSDDTRELVKKYCLNSPQILSAPEMFACVVRTKTWKFHRQQILKEMKEKEVGFSWPKFLWFYYEKICLVSYTQGFLNSLGFVKALGFRLLRLFSPSSLPPCSKNDMKVWAVKNGSLAFQTLMLSFRAYGYDTCALEGFDQKRLSRFLKLPKDAYISMVIVAGKRSPQDWAMGPRLRLDRSFYVKEV